MILEKLLPTSLTFVLSSDRDINDPFDEIVLSFLKPLIKFFSGEVLSDDKNAPTLTSQIVNIMVGEEDFLSAEAVRRHIEKLALTISDMLILRTLCEVLCSVLQDTNLTAINGRSVTTSDYLDDM